MAVGLICAVLIALQVSKALTDKRLEFFREASSGYNINSYFTAVNIVTTIEVTFSMIVVAFVSAWLREPVAYWGSFFVHFIVLGWLCASWALFFPMFVPVENVPVVIGFFIATGSLILGGVIPPVEYKDIYEGGLTEYLSGWLSPTRFFIEGLTVGEVRCLPPQHGWSVADTSVNFPRDEGLMRRPGAFRYAIHDPDATKPSCDGWYWGIYPSVVVALTIRFAALMAMHVFNRAQQTKKPFLFELKRNNKYRIYSVVSIVILFLLGWWATWAFTRDIAATFEFIGLEKWVGLEKDRLVAEYSTSGSNLLLLNQAFDPGTVSLFGSE